MSNRRMIKWAPFNAVASGTFMVNEVVNEKSKTMMPILSDDQKLYLQEKMIEAFNNGEYVKIKYFKKGTYYIIEGFITNIDQISRKFTINKEFSIFFSQIIEFL